MPTPPVTTKSEPERPATGVPAQPEGAPAKGGIAGSLPAAPPNEQDDQRQQPSAEPVEALSSDRAVPADLLVDVPQLTVEELTLELEASLLLNRVKLDAKGLEAGLYVRADFERLQALTGKDSDVHDSQRGSDGVSVRRGLRGLLGATRGAYRVLSAREALERVTTSDDSDTSVEGPAGERHHDGDGGPARATRGRALHAAKQGAKAAGLTAAGVAGGAVLEAQLKPSQKLPIPRRRNRARAMLDAVRP